MSYKSGGANLDVFFELLPFFSLAAVKSSLRRLHHPFGVPSVVQPDATFCLLHQPNYITGYSHDRHMALWVSYTIPNLVSLSSLNIASADVGFGWGGSQ